MFQLIDYQRIQEMKHTIFMFHFSFNVSLQKNTVGAIQKHWGRDLKTLRERWNAPSVFKKMKHETKDETWN